MGSGKIKRSLAQEQGNLNTLLLSMVPGSPLGNPFPPLQPHLRSALHTPSNQVPFIFTLKVHLQHSAILDKPQTDAHGTRISSRLLGL